MHVYNIHRREIAADARTVGCLIDGLATADDQLWPSTDWPAMRFDPPGVTGRGTGGHGPVGYRVEHHEPGRSVTFSFTNRPRGLHGRHQFIVQPTGRASCVLWHLTDIAPRGWLRLTWWPFWAPLHNAVIEDSLDRAECVARASGRRTGQDWTLCVRALRAIGRWLNYGSLDPRRNGTPVDTVARTPVTLRVQC
jgi:hypothetical protein